MSGYALEPVGLYGLEQLNADRLGQTAKPKKQINPQNVRGIIIRIPKEAYDGLVQQIQPVLDELNTKGHWTSGSAGSWHPSHPYYKMGSVKTNAGDIDIHISSKEIAPKLGLAPDADDQNIRASFAKYLKQSFDFVTQTGEQVHTALPSGNEIDVPALGAKLPTFYQIDFPTTEHAATTVKHHEHDYVKDYDWDGQDQQFALASLANTIPNNLEKAFLYYGMGGSLKSRANGEVLERDINKIAQRLFNDPQANQDWLATVDRILTHIPNGLENPRLAQFKGDMQKKYPDRFLKEGTADWFANLRSKLNIL
jgi:hypothetical protein